MNLEAKMGEMCLQPRDTKCCQREAGRRAWKRLSLGASGGTHSASTLTWAFRPLLP